MRKGLHSALGWGWGQCSWSRCSGSSHQVRELHSRTTEITATWVKRCYLPHKAVFINKEKNVAWMCTKPERENTDSWQKCKINISIIFYIRQEFVYRKLPAWQQWNILFSLSLCVFLVYSSQMTTTAWNLGHDADWLVQHHGPISIQNI